MGNIGVAVHKSGIRQRPGHVRVEHGGRQRYITAADALAERHDVNLDAVMLMGEKGTGTSTAAHYLVGDQQHPVAAADGLDPRQVPGLSRYRTQR